MFQATQNNIESFLGNTTASSSTDDEAHDPLSNLRENFTGSYITTLADELVMKYGSPTMTRMNDVLNNWHHSWTIRKSHDPFKENRTFLCDPMRFWWLAKLYLVLHFHRDKIRKDSEWQALGSEFADEHSKAQTQLKVVSWLLQLRRPQDEVTSSTEHYLAHLLRPADGG